MLVNRIVHSISARSKGRSIVLVPTKCFWIPSWDANIMHHGMYATVHFDACWWCRTLDIGTRQQVLAYVQKGQNYTVLKSKCYFTHSAKNRKRYVASPTAGGPSSSEGHSPHLFLSKDKITIYFKARIEFHTFRHKQHGTLHFFQVWRPKPHRGP